MEFLFTNLIQTTTSVIVDSNTSTVENLLRRDETFQYFTNGFANDATTASLTLSLGSSQVVSRIGLIGHNLKAFTIFYDGVPANTFNLTSTANTSTTDYSSNSETSNYFSFSPQTVSSITIDMKGTIQSNSEKAIGYMHVSDAELVFERVPSAKNYKPLYKPKEVAHKLSDGGTRLHNIDRKFEAKIKYKFISEEFRNDLFSIWKRKDSYTFVAFGTTSGWDTVLHEVVWPGSFDFFRFSDDALGSGFSGTISIREVS